MRVENIRIENFRAFKGADVPIGRYTCLVGPNGSGKSTIIRALDVFFGKGKELQRSDFHHGHTAEPVRIFVTFGGLSDEAKEVLRHYVRDGQLIVEARAVWDEGRQVAPIVQYGFRKGMAAFKRYFAAAKGGESVATLKGIYANCGKQSLSFLTRRSSRGWRMRSMRSRVPIRTYARRLRVRTSSTGSAGRA